MLIGIDLLWVRPKLCGGTESYIRNLMQGFGTYDEKHQYLLFVARDNADSFQKYAEYQNMELVVCPVNCGRQWKRILWENLHLDRMARKHYVDMMFIPVYSKPVTYGSKIPYVSVIHDLQALHYPEYFSRVKRLFLQYMWWYAAASSQWVVTDSDFCKDDIIEHYPWVKNRISTIYAPIITESSRMDFTEVGSKFGIEADAYYYCVSSLLPHKNLETLLKTMALRKKRGYTEPLVVSGVGGDKTLFEEKVAQFDIADVVINTGFVSDEERDCLYENCRLFLFPSVFEGFGMPPIEAMRKGKRVVTTNQSCLYEVTDGKAYYVEEPFNAEAWADQMTHAQQQPERQFAFEQYSLQVISDNFIRLFEKVSSR